MMEDPGRSSLSQSISSTTVELDPSLGRHGRAMSQSGLRSLSGPTRVILPAVVDENEVLAAVASDIMINRT